MMKILGGSYFMPSLRLEETEKIDCFSSGRSLTTELFLINLQWFCQFEDYSSKNRTENGPYYLLAMQIDRLQSFI